MVINVFQSSQSPNQDKQQQPGQSPDQFDRLAMKLFEHSQDPNQNPQLNNNMLG
jgi:hypothetical protein